MTILKNRTFKLIYLTAYLSIAFVAILASVGFFECRVRNGFYVYFTNLSNYLCIGIMAAEFIQTLKSPDGTYTSVFRKLKFASVLAIMTTFVVYNFVLVPVLSITPYSQFEVSSFLMHMLLPIMFTVDWFLFYERKKVKWYYPLLAALIPFVYGSCIYIRAAFYGFHTDKTILYPYFFMNINAFDISTIAKWQALILTIYILCGYILLIIDKITAKKNRII